MTFKLPKVRPTSKAVTDSHTRSKTAAECLAVLNAQTLTPQVLEQMAGDEEAHRQKLDGQNMREHAARARRQAEAAKQVQDDQRVIADAIRAGQILPSTPIDQKQMQTHRTMVTKSRAVTVFEPWCEKIKSILEEPNKYPWLQGCYEKKEGSNRNMWCLEKLYEVLKSQNRLEGEPSFDDIMNPPERGQSPGSVGGHKLVALLNAATKTHRCN